MKSENTYSRRGCPRAQGASGTSRVGRGSKRLDGDARGAFMGKEDDQSKG